MLAVVLGARGGVSILGCSGGCGNPPSAADAGLVCDKGLTLGDLIGTLHLFFQRLGLPKLRFKPAYNPYTEPSMEIFRWEERQTIRTPSPAWRSSGGKKDRQS
jgi:tRNA synthetases class II core domain (F)